MEVLQSRTNRSELGELWKVYERDKAQRKLRGNGKNIERTIQSIVKGKKPDFNMMWEIMENSLDGVFRFLLKEDKSLVHLKGSRGTTLLMKSVELKNLNALRALLEFKSFVNATDDRGFTALHFAVSKSKGFLPFIKVLIECGADVTKKAIKSITPLSLALKSHNSVLSLLLTPKVYRKIKSKRIRRSILIAVSAINDKTLLKSLLKSDKYAEEIDSSDEFGKTALMYACEKEHCEVAEILLKSKASMYVKDERGRDALFFAALNGNTSIIKLFTRRHYRLKNADLSEDFRLNYPNALFAAFENHSSNFELIKTLTLMSSEKTLNCPDLHGNTLLHLAVEQKNYKIIKILVESKANSEIKNANDEIPFDIAVKNRDLQAAESLIIEANSCDKLEDSIRRGNAKFVIGLLKCGHEVEERHIDAAIDSGKETLIEYDNRISERKHSEDLWFSFFGLLLEKIEGDRGRIVSDAVVSAIKLSNFKLIQQFYDSEFIQIFEEKCWEFSKSESTPSEMLTFLQRFLNAEIRKKAIRILYDELSKFDDNVEKYSIQEIYGSPVEYEFYKFLYCLIKFKIEGYDLDDFFCNKESILEFAIKYFRMDLAMALLTFGVRPRVQRRFEDIIEIKFKHKFKELHKNFKESGLWSLEEFARIAVRCDVRGFERMQHNRHARKMLLFNGSYFYEEIIDVNLESVLVWISNFEDDHEDKKGIATLMMSEIVDVLTRSQFASETSNKIFPAINEEKCDELKEYLSSENFKFSDLIMTDVYALHYAIALGKKDIVECLVAFKCPNLCTRNNLFTCADIAKMFEHFSIVEYLSAQSGFKEGDEVRLLPVSPEDIKQKPLDEFLLILFDWKSKGFGVDDVLSNGQPLLKAAIESGREDIAAVLLQKGARLILEEEFVEFIAGNCSDDFNKLYEESRINGSRGLNLILFEDRLRISKNCIQFFEFDIKMTNSEAILAEIMDSSVLFPIINREFSCYKSLLATYDKNFLQSLFNSLLPDLPSYESRDRLYAMIKSGHLKNVKELIRLQNINLNKFYKLEELNIFHYSIVIGNMEVVKLILYHKVANVRTRRNLFSCVELAQMFGHVQIAQYLAALPKFKTQYYVIPMNKSVNNMNASDLFCQLGEYGMNDFFANGTTVLQTAIENKREDVATLLLQKGANPTLNNRHETILREKCSPELNDLYDECRVEGLQTLERLSRIATRQNLTLLHRMWKYRCFRSVLEFRSKSYSLKDIDSIDPKSIRSFLPELDTLLTHDSGIWGVSSANDNIKSHPLFSALKDRNVDEIRRLIEKERTKVNSFYGKDVRNAFHYAICLGKVELVKLLLEYGALERPILTNKYFDRPVYCAELADICGHFDVVMFLSTLSGFKTIKSEPELKFLNYHYSILERMKVHG